MESNTQRIKNTIYNFHLYIYIDSSPNNIKKNGIFKKY